MATNKQINKYIHAKDPPPKNNPTSPRSPRNLIPRLFHGRFCDRRRRIPIRHLLDTVSLLRRIAGISRERRRRRSAVLLPVQEERKQADDSEGEEPADGDSGNGARGQRG